MNLIFNEYSESRNGRKLCLPNASLFWHAMSAHTPFTIAIAMITVVSTLMLAPTRRYHLGNLYNLRVTHV